MDNDVVESTMEKLTFHAKKKKDLRDLFALVIHLLKLYMSKAYLLALYPSFYRLCAQPVCLSILWPRFVWQIIIMVSVFLAATRAHLYW